MSGGDRDLGENFDALIGQLDYPMFVATRSRAGAGCLVGFATQCSVGPPRFPICLSQTNRTCRIAREATIGVRLGPSSAALFGGETGDEVDKFAHCEWDEGERGVPLEPEHQP
jgi:flavin reductase (DIM6/NTAB) family NADH-FMN oxidoreductase RutF